VEWSEASGMDQVELSGMGMGMDGWMDQVRLDDGNEK
jgi:hypothetical protein